MGAHDHNARAAWARAMETRMPNRRSFRALVLSAASLAALATASPVLAATGGNTVVTTGVCQQDANADVACGDLAVATGVSSTAAGNVAIATGAASTAV